MTRGVKQAGSGGADRYAFATWPDGEPSAAPADRQARPAPAEVHAQSRDDADAAVEPWPSGSTRRCLRLSAIPTRPAPAVPRG
jgi:hypothetical protein